MARGKVTEIALFIYVVRASDSLVKNLQFQFGRRMVRTEYYITGFFCLFKLMKDMVYWLTLFI